MTRMRISVFLFAVGLACLTGCSGPTSMPVRLEREWAPWMFGRTDTLYAAAEGLEQRYPGFGRTYLELLMQAPMADTAAFVTRARRFAEDAFVAELYGAVEEAYPDFRREAEQLDEAFLRFEAMFPSHARPETVTAVSLLGESAMIGGRVLAIALDKYLGADAALYREAGYAGWQLRGMQRAALVPDAVRAWLYTEFPNHPAHVLDAMVYEGKVAWTVSRLCPSVADSVLFGFSAAQLAWCRDYRHAVWKAVTDGRLLYETDGTLIRRLMSPGPYTARLSADAPGRTLCWMGCDIIRAYMRRHPRVSLQELFDETDAHTILHEARYNP